jgi:hypothetical protein
MRGAAMTNTTITIAGLVASSTIIAGLSGCVVRREQHEVVTTRNIPVTREVREEIVVQRPPMPAPRVEIRTIQPASDYRWVDGHYEWNGADWQWSPGYWAP